jgi:hypothetical protein
MARFMDRMAPPFFTFINLDGNFAGAVHHKVQQVVEFQCALLSPGKTLHCFLQQAAPTPVSVFVS